MWIDPVVEEVRKHRREIAAEAGNSLAEICRRAREAELRIPERMARPDQLPPKKDKTMGETSPEGLPR